MAAGHGNFGLFPGIAVPPICGTFDENTKKIAILFK